MAFLYPELISALDAKMLSQKNCPVKKDDIVGKILSHLSGLIYQQTVDGKFNLFFDYVSDFEIDGKSIWNIFNKRNSPEENITNIINILKSKGYKVEDLLESSDVAEIEISWQ